MIWGENPLFKETPIYTPLYTSCFDPHQMPPYFMPFYQKTVWGNHGCQPRSRDGWLMSDAAPTICLHASYRCGSNRLGGFLLGTKQTAGDQTSFRWLVFFFGGGDLVYIYISKISGRWDITSHLVKDPWCLFVLYNGIIHNCLENCSIEVQVSSWTSVMSQFLLNLNCCLLARNQHDKLTWEEGDWAGESMAWNLNAWKEPLKLFPFSVRVRKEKRCEQVKKTRNTDPVFLD